MKWVIDYLYPRNFDAASIPDLNGKVILVTGGCNGIGYEIASQCAIHNALHIIILSPASPRLNNVVRSISAKLSNTKGKHNSQKKVLLEGKVDAVPTNLADLSSVFRAVERVRTLTTIIDIVFANAGVSKGPTPLSPDGLETVFATNYVGHYALITRLLPVLLETGSKDGADVRVVLTSSSVAWNVSKLDFADFKRPFVKGKGWETDPYDRSKLACLLFGMKLADHIRDRGGAHIHVNIADPGIIFGTQMHLQLDMVHTLPVQVYITILDWWYGFSIEEGALTSLFLGTSPVIAQKQVNGKFYRPFGYALPRNKYPTLASNELAEKLWDWTEDVVSTEEAKIRLQS